MPSKAAADVRTGPPAVKFQRIVLVRGPIEGEVRVLALSWPKEAHQSVPDAALVVFGALSVAAIVDRNSTPSTRSEFLLKLSLTPRTEFYQVESYL